VTTLRAGIIAGLVACAVLVAGFWFLNSTRAGLSMKCSVFNDVGACFAYALSQPLPLQPPNPAEDPAVAAERQRAEEERRHQDTANRAVAAASYDLELAIDQLAYVAEAALDEAANISDPAADLRQAVADQRAVYEELHAVVAAGPTDEFWVDEVSFVFYDVEFARNDVDFARDGIEFASSSIEDARDQRDELEAAVRLAISALESAQGRNPIAVAPSYSVASAERELERRLADIDDTIAAYDEQLAQVEALIVEADQLMADASALAASVGAE